MKKLRKPTKLASNAILYSCEGKANSEGDCGNKTNNSPCGDKVNTGNSCGYKANWARRC